MDYWEINTMKGEVWRCEDLGEGPGVIPGVWLLNTGLLELNDNGGEEWKRHGDYLMQVFIGAANIAEIKHIKQ